MAKTPGQRQAERAPPQLIPGLVIPMARCKDGFVVMTLVPARSARAASAA
jgi:hypothetical protein